MITTYLTTIKAAFNPFTITSKVPRLFLNVLPASAHKTIKISATQFPRASAAPAILELGFQDGKTMKYSWAPEALQQTEGSGKKLKSVSLQDIIEEVDRHARGLARKQELTG